MFFKFKQNFIDMSADLWYNRRMDYDKYLKLITEDYSEKFGKFKKLLVEQNGICNLTAILDDEGVLYKHFLDSVVGESFFPNGAEVVEIGSGGGFPSVPLKIIRDDLKFTQIDSTGKKCRFLELVKERLPLEGVRVLNLRAEEGAKDFSLRERFDIACARAVARLNVLSEYCLPYVKVGGSFIAYKGECGEEVKEAENAVKLLGGEMEKIESFTLPNCGERTLVIVKKIKPTPLKYPRGQGKERKQPLS